MNKILVLYHANCADGFGAAWAAWKKLGDTADYKPVTYGKEPPDVSQYYQIYVLDFSYAPIVMERWMNDGIYQRTVTVVDHHRTAEDMLRGFPGAIFDITHSGAYLAWQYFHPETEVPLLIKMVEDRDMWWWKLPYSREVSAALWSYPMRFDVWSNFAIRLEHPDYDPQHIVSEGAAILRYMQQLVELICNQAHWTNYFEHLGYQQVACVNATSLWSEVGEELLKLYPESPFSAYFHRLKDGKIKWGLRSKGDFDVSAIAKTFGGGGHKNAAGFVE